PPAVVPVPAVVVPAPAAVAPPAEPIIVLDDEPLLVVPPGSPNRPPLGAPRKEQCYRCFSSAAYGRSRGECHEPVGGNGKRCHRCVSGHSCFPVPAELAPFAANLRRLFQEELADEYDMEVIEARSAARAALRQYRLEAAKARPSATFVALVSAVVAAALAAVLAWVLRDVYHFGG
ncbi:hypothetical protein F4861DRAFT_544518, partial [Xylaria intraflava]